MLFEKDTLKIGDIIVLKLNSGTEIVARLIKSGNSSSLAKTTDAWTISKPLVAQPMPDRDGISLAFMPFSLTARDDEEFEFTLDRMILRPFLANDDVKQSYIQNTSSLALPPVPKLIA